MYNYVDTNDNDSSVILPPEALRLNGQYIENVITGYRTLHVSGRELLSREIGTTDVGSRDGSVYQSRRYPARNITVTYQLVAASNGAFRSAYNRLCALLDVQNAELVFADESDKFFVGTPSEMSEVEPGKNAVTGEFTLLCADPFKYSLIEHEVESEEARGSAIVQDEWDYDANEAPYGAFSAYYKGQVLDHTVTAGTIVRLIGENAGDYSYGVDYIFDPVRNAVFVTENVWLAGFDAWEYATSDTVEDTKSALFLINYNGTRAAFPVLQASFPAQTDASGKETSNGDCGFVAFMNDKEKVIQLGDPEESDGEEFDKSQVLMNQVAFNTYNSAVWPSNVGAVSSDSFAAAGSVGVAKLASTNILKATSCGSGSKWHGANITHVVAADAAGDVGAANFQFSWKQRFGIGSTKTASKEKGVFQLLLVNINGSTKRIVAGISVIKNKTGKVGTIRLYVNGRTVKDFTNVNLEKYNRDFGYTHSFKNAAEEKAFLKKNGWTKPVLNSSISKYGQTVTFKIGSKSFTYTDSGVEAMKVHQITFGFYKYATTAYVATNVLYNAKFIKDYCLTYRDVPNKFTAGDKLIADCNDGSVLLNGSVAAELGALGNDWEDFVLVPGPNQIKAAWSPWTEADENPEIKIKYREVFL